jgi:uncharacterized membrane protein YkvI
LVHYLPPARIFFQSLVIAGGYATGRELVEFFLRLVALIAKGYGFMTWVFILVFVVPVLTIGLARILRRNSAE